MSDVIFRRAKLEIEIQFRHSEDEKSYARSYLHHLVGLRVEPEPTDLLPEHTVKIRRYVDRLLGLPDVSPAVREL